MLVSEWIANCSLNYLFAQFTLFLALSLNRTYTLILDLIKCQEQLAIIEKNKITSKDGAHSSADGVKLKQLQSDYDALSAKYSTATGSASAKKVD